MSQRGVAHDHRRNGRLAHSRVESQPGQPGLEVAGVVPQPLDPLGLLLEHVERRETGSRHRRRMRGGEQEGPRPVIEEIDQVAAAAHVSTQHADGFRERPHLDVHAPVEAKVIHGAAPVLAQDSRGVRVVHHHDGPMAFGRLDQRGQRPYVPVHGEDAVRDEQLAAGLAFQLRQDLLRRGGVFVRKHVDLGLGEAAAVDDAGVIQLVGDDVVFGPQNRRNRAGVGCEARLKHHARLHVLEARDALLQLHVQTHGAGDGAHRAGSHAVAPGGLQGCLAEARMRGQPQVIVGGQVDDLFAVEARFRRARRFQDAQPLVGARLPPGPQLLAQESQRVTHAGPQAIFGTTYGARYCRVNMRLASGSFLQERVSGSKCSVRPRR